MSIISIVIFTSAITRGVSLDQNCTGYLKRAADANTVETAKEQLQVAIQYLEDNDMTKGHTSVLWKTPDEDVGFWYKNLKASHLELSRVDSTTTQLVRTNLLMKLRETLLDGGKEGETLTSPPGLSRFPNNGAWAIALLAASAMVIGVFILGCSIWQEDD